MQLQRRYNLPNCTLLLDGLADTSGDPGYSQRLGVLMNLDCYLSGQQEPLSGGVDFLLGLIQAVSHYAQQFLSGIPHPLAQMGTAPVQVRSLGADLHEIQIYEPARTEPQRRISLTTVQLFDLVEALDQLLADPLTLPQLIVPLHALQRKEAADRVPLVERAAAPAIGTVGLALAATVFFLMPPPDIERPLVDPLPGEEQTLDSEEETADDAEVPTENPSNDRQALLELNTQLYDQINQAWTEEPQYTESLIYRVSLNNAGEIRGYREENAAASRYVQETPLGSLLTVPTEGASAETLTDFKVVFTPDRRLEVNPWDGFPPEGEAALTIEDPVLIEQLNRDLRDQLDENWSRAASFQEVLIFRFTLNDQGQILDFQPASSAANLYPAELNLPTVEKPAEQTEPTLDFRVVFKPTGVIEVSPWDGF